MSLGSASNFFLGAASATGGGAYEIERSLRFNSADSAYLNRTPSSASNRRTWTWSGWVKRSSLGSRQQIFGAVTSGSVFGSLEFNSLDSLTFYEDTLGSFSVVFTTNRIFKDISAWYHIVLALDTTQTTASDRVKLYVNGAQETSFSAGPSVVADGEGLTNSTTGHNIGSWTPASSSLNLNAYLAETHFVDGQQLAASDFGEYDSNNVWQPKEFTGTYDRGANQSQVWSTATTVSFYGSTQNGNTSTIADVFDGSETTGYYVLDSSATGPGLCYKLTFPSGVRGSRVRFRTGGDAGAAAALNTEVVGDLVGGSAYTWYTIYEGAETDIDYIVFGNNDSGGTRNNISNAIEIDGKLLVDSGISLTDNSFYLNFSDNSSNSALGTDSSGNGNDWTVNNIEAVAAFGIENACSIYGPSYETFSFPITYTTTVTFEAFVRVTTSVSYNYLAYNSSNNWNLGITTNSVLFGDFTGGYTTFTGTNVDDGDWHFLRLTTDGSNTSLYIDGVLHATNASDGGVSTGTEVTNDVRSAGTGRMRVAYMRITTGGTPPTTGIPALADMNQPAGTGGTLAFFDKLDDIAGSGTKTSDGGNVTITMAAATVTTNKSGTDSLIDSPTNYEAESGNNGGNYATLNPLIGISNGGTPSNGNLDWSDGNNLSTIEIPSSGKWYAEQTITGLGADVSFGASFGVRSYDFNRYARLRTAADRGQTSGLGTASTPSYSQLSVEDVIGIAVDSDGGSITFYVNNSSVYQITSITDISGLFFYTAFASSGDTGSWNFGQRSFAYTPPTDHLSLCTTNLADPTIADGSTEMGTELYTGNGSTQSISGYDFSPDFVWMKGRSGARNHGLFNTVTGVNKGLHSNLTDAEFNDSSTLTAFNSDGFSLSTNATFNANTETFAAWAWDAGDSNTTISAGSLNSSTYDQSAVWSDNTTASDSFDSGTLPQAFDGKLTTGPLMTGQTTTYVVDLSSDFTDGTIQVYTAGYQKIDVTDDGGTNREIFDGSESGYGWFPATPATFTNIQSVTIKPQGSGASNSNELRAVKVNGKILVDSDQTPTDIPAATSTVRANTSAGFSVVTWTAVTATPNTIGHGVNATPEFVITKSRTSANHWAIWHKDLPTRSNLLRFTTGSYLTSSNYWQTDEEWTSNTFGVFSTADSGDNNYGDMVAYCFAPVEGYSKFGSYTGNGSTDGPYVFTGFRPQWLLVKSSTATYGWLMVDAVRNTYNYVDNYLYADSSTAELSNVSDLFTFTANGFKVGNSSASNTNSATFVYAAFAEHPFKTARAR